MISFKGQGFVLRFAYLWTSIGGGRHPRLPLLKTALGIRLDDSPVEL